MFELNERLRKDTFKITDLELSTLLLMNDSTVPWVILVPKRLDTTEIHQLLPHDRSLLIEEIALVSKMLEDEFSPDKINVAALGNIVSQLHIHVIARYRGDRAWPGPVWSASGAEPYSEEAARDVMERIRKRLGISP